MVLMEVYGGGGGGDVSAAASASSEERSVYARRSNKVGRYVVKLRIMTSGSRRGYVDSNYQEEMEGGVGQSPEVGGSPRFGSQKDSLELKNINHGHGSEEEEEEEEDGYDEMMNEGERNQSQQQQLMTSTSKTKEFICSVCKKKFTSMKSLSGHMRCHPERNWRGIQPPPSALRDHDSSPTTRITPQRDDDHDDDDDGNSSAPSTSADDSDHHVWSLSSWPVTAKRSRSTFQLASLEEIQEMVSDAVESLLLLSQGNPLRRKMSEGVGEEEEEFGGDESRDLLLNNAEEESGVSGDGCSPKSMNKENRREGEDGLFDLERQKSDDEEEEESESKKMIMNFYQQRQAS